MSIEVKTPHDLCDNCPMLEPKVQRINITSYGDKSQRVINTVYCENVNSCHIHYLEKELDDKIRGNNS